MEFRFCPDCGAVLVPRLIGDEGLVPYCEACAIPRFGFSYNCIIALPVNAQNPDEVALIRQDYVSRKSHICVAGYVKHGETLEACACREVEEELGLRVCDAVYTRSYYFERKDLLMLGFVVRVSKEDFNISGEVDSARWFSLDEAEDELQNASIALQLLRDYRAGREQVHSTLDPAGRENA